MHGEDQYLFQEARGCFGVAEGAQEERTVKGDAMGQTIQDRQLKVLARADEANRNNPRYRDAAYDLVMAAKDALQSLKRLPDVDGAYRVSCIQQLETALRKAGAIPGE